MISFNMSSTPPGAQRESNRSLLSDSEHHAGFQSIISIPLAFPWTLHGIGDRYWRLDLVGGNVDVVQDLAVGGDDFG